MAVFEFSVKPALLRALRTYIKSGLGVKVLAGTKKVGASS